MRAPRVGQPGCKWPGWPFKGELAGQNPSAASAHLDLSTFLEAFNGSNRYVLDYLVEEVFQDQPAEVQAFLLKTSILERMSAGLCAAVMDDLPDASAAEEAALPVKQRAAHYQALLEHLDRSNLFILPLDNQHSWFRYHMLFGDLLRNRLEATLPEQVQAPARARQPLV
jgi:LuxR family transcriptional regulator, maltose regulon positive regulatory protein